MGLFSTTEKGLGYEETPPEEKKPTVANATPITQLDRVNYSFGFKVNLGNYESADAHVSLSRDVSLGRTPEEVIREISAIVEKEAEQKYKELSAKKTGDAKPKAEAYTPKKEPEEVAGVKCPKCGGDTYDNRFNKKNPKGADYTCKNAECKSGKYKTAGWLQPDGKTISWSK